MAMRWKHPCENKPPIGVDVLAINDRYEIDIVIFDSDSECCEDGDVKWMSAMPRHTHPHFGLRRFLAIGWHELPDEFE